jgi:hypothetical protein
VTLLSVFLETEKIKLGSREGVVVGIWDGLVVEDTIYNLYAVV